MAQPLSQDAAGQIREQAAAWMASETRRLRADLDDHFGDGAKEAFAGFVSDYTTAESQNNLHYLGQLATDARLGDTPLEFSAMRRLVMDQWLTEPFQNGSRLLGEVQTWIELLQGQSPPPPLASRLARARSTSPPPVPHRPPPPRPANPLATRSPPSRFSTPCPKTTAVNPMEAIAQARQDKRERARMTPQPACSRWPWNSRPPNRIRLTKTAEAHADAEAMRAQAQNWPPWNRRPWNHAPTAGWDG